MADLSVIDILKKLISCESVTPMDDGAQVYLKEILSSLGFECYVLPFGDVPNLFARIGTGAPHLCYAGHTDVVPAGDPAQWDSPPFEPSIRGNEIYGRGASDMKGSVAAFISAADRFIKHSKSFQGSLSLLITGDEEEAAIDGTVKVLEWMKANGHIPNVALVGEPTNPEALGQEIKIGRRGSLTGTLKVRGTQGHVAYQDLADNPLPRLISLLKILTDYKFDTGTEFFAPTNLEVTTIDVGNVASNVIPQSGHAKFNIRFNDLWSAATLEAKLREILQAAACDYDLSCYSNAECFLTKPGEWTRIAQDAVEQVTKRRPALTTSGGTSDARFITQYAPVVECGAVNASIHQINEHANIDDLETLVEIYEVLLGEYFNNSIAL